MNLDKHFIYMYKFISYIVEDLENKLNKFYVNVSYFKSEYIKFMIFFI